MRSLPQKPLSDGVENKETFETSGLLAQQSVLAGERSQSISQSIEGSETRRTNTNITINAENAEHSSREWQTFIAGLNYFVTKLDGELSKDELIEHRRSLQGRLDQLRPREFPVGPKYPKFARKHVLETIGNAVTISGSMATLTMGLAVGLGDLLIAASSTAVVWAAPVLITAAYVVARGLKELKKNELTNEIEAIVTTEMLSALNYRQQALEIVYKEKVKHYLKQLSDLTYSRAMDEREAELASGEQLSHLENEALIRRIEQLQQTQQAPLQLKPEHLDVLTIDQIDELVQSFESDVAAKFVGQADRLSSNSPGSAFGIREQIKLLQPYQQQSELSTEQAAFVFPNRGTQQTGRLGRAMRWLSKRLSESSAVFGLSAGAGALGIVLSIFTTITFFGLVSAAAVSGPIGLAVLGGGILLGLGVGIAFGVLHHRKQKQIRKNAERVRKQSSEIKVLQPQQQELDHKISHLKTKINALDNIDGFFASSENNVNRIRQLELSLAEKERQLQSQEKGLHQVEVDHQLKETEILDSEKSLSQQNLRLVQEKFEFYQNKHHYYSTVIKMSQSAIEISRAMEKLSKQSVKLEDLNANLPEELKHFQPKIKRLLLAHHEGIELGRQRMNALKDIHDNAKNANLVFNNQGPKVAFDRS